MDIAVILPAAGLGRRFSEAAGDDAAEARRSKLEADLAGRPVFMRTIELFAGRRDVRQIILAVNPDTIEDFRFKWGDALAFHGVTIAAGGRQERWETVQRALEVVADTCTHVAVHDAVRPLTSPKLIDRVFEALGRYSAVIPGVAVDATLKRVEPEPQVEQESDPLDAILCDAGRPTLKIERVRETLDRRGVVAVQTPQAFEIGLLRRAYAQIADGKLDATRITDDAGLVEALADPAHPVRVVEGEATNLKITRSDDLKLAEAIWGSMHQEDLKQAARMRLFADEDE